MEAALSGILIVGTGQAGLQAAMSLREVGYEKPIRLVGEEPGLPYQRPPLSKAFLDGQVDEDMLRLRPQSYFDEHRIDLIASERAARIHRETREVSLQSGQRLAFDHLILATGARNRAIPVPGANLDGVVQLRDLANAADLRRRLETARRVVVVGAGFIGMEIAAFASARGMQVTVVEATERPMSRALSRTMSQFFRGAHEARGVAFAFGATAVAIEEENGRAGGVRIADGRTMPADIVLVGIGVIPNMDLAVDAQLPVANGILVDEYLLTEDPGISAIGDCAAHPSRFANGATIRIESVQNAVDQAKCVAARIAGRPEPYASVPWFWSDQGGLKLQIAGLSTPHDLAVARGRPESGGFSVFCFGGGRLLGVESVNRPADHMMARRLLAAGAPLDPEQAADPAFDLKTLALRAGSNGRRS